MDSYTIIAVLLDGIVRSLDIHPDCRPNKQELQKMAYLPQLIDLDLWIKIE